MAQGMPLHPVPLSLGPAVFGVLGQRTVRTRSELFRLPGEGSKGTGWQWVASQSAAGSAAEPSCESGAGTTGDPPQPLSQVALQSVFVTGPLISVRREPSRMNRR